MVIRLFPATRWRGFLDGDSGEVRVHGYRRELLPWVGEGGRLFSWSAMRDHSYLCAKQRRNIREEINQRLCCHSEIGKLSIGGLPAENARTITTALRVPPPRVDSLHNLHSSHSRKTMGDASQQMKWEHVRRFDFNINAALLNNFLLFQAACEGCSRTTGVFV